jgi:hypothetical protein
VAGSWSIIGSLREISSPRVVEGPLLGGVPMRKLVILPLVWTAIAGIALAGGMTVSDPGRDGALPLPPDPEACWSQPGDLGANALSSMTHSEYGDLSLVANDFIFDHDSEIVLVRWWGAAW